MFLLHGWMKKRTGTLKLPLLTEWCHCYKALKEPGSHNGNIGLLRLSQESLFFPRAKELLAC